MIVKYSGITVAQDTQLRKQLREAGVTYKVYKNTLMTRAFKGTEFEGLTDSLRKEPKCDRSQQGRCDSASQNPEQVWQNLSGNRAESRRGRGYFVRRKGNGTDCKHSFKRRASFPSSLEVSSLRLQTSLVCLIEIAREGRSETLVSLHLRQRKQQQNLQLRRQRRQRLSSIYKNYEN